MAWICRACSGSREVMGHPPRRVVVVGIEGENFADGVGLSPAVELAVAEAGDLVLQVIDEASTCA